jgi:hypothetical protein
MGTLMSVDTRCGFGKEGLDGDAEDDEAAGTVCEVFLGRFFFPSPFPIMMRKEEADDVGVEIVSGIVFMDVPYNEHDTAEMGGAKNP